MNQTEKQLLEALDTSLGRLREMLVQGHLYTQLAPNEIKTVMHGRAGEMLRAAEAVYTAVTGVTLQRPRGAL